MGSRQLREAGFKLLLLMLPLLQVVSARMLEMENSGDDASDEQQKSDDAEKQSPADEDGSAEPEVQIEATKRLWIEELTAKAKSKEESADLIEKIRRRTSGSGLRHLKAACRALCPRCVCGVILMPSFPTGQASKSGPKLLLVKPAAKSDAKPKKLQAKTTIKPPVTMTPPAVVKKETGKKVKKWLLGMANKRSQLSDFLLNEDISSSVYKREVGDHDPLSESGDAQSHFGID